MNKLLASTLLSTLIGGLCVSLSAGAKPVERQVGASRVNWTTGQMVVTGTGAVRAGMPKGPARLMARRAAMADAYRLLAEAVEGVQVFAETTVNNYTTTNDRIKVQVQASIRGAQTVGTTRYLSDGTVEVDVQLPIFGSGSVAQAIQFGQAVKNQFSMPFRNPLRYLAYRGYDLAMATPEWEPEGVMTAASTTPYTGLVIDATGLAAEPAMGPFIVGSGKRLHPNGNIGIDPERIVKEGPLHYVEDLDDALTDVARVGNNPLVIEAKAAVGNPIHSNILLSKSSAVKIEQENKTSRFLDQLKVVLVL